MFAIILIIGIMIIFSKFYTSKYSVIQIDPKINLLQINNFISNDECGPSY